MHDADKISTAVSTLSCANDLVRAFEQVPCGGIAVFGYWMGKLPEIAELHFASVLKALGPLDRYFLLTNSAEPLPYTAAAYFAGPQMVHYVLDVDALFASFGQRRLVQRTPFGRITNSFVYRAIRIGALHRLPITRKLIGKIAYDGGPLGLTRRTVRWLPAPYPTLPAIADYVRVAVTSLVPTTTLYLDLDVAVLRPFSTFTAEGSFVYRWENFDFANSAIMLRTQTDKESHASILDRCLELGTPLPWILFHQDECRRFGLAVQSSDDYDPLWSSSFCTAEDFDDFIEDSADADDYAQRLMDHFRMVHWHNKWDRTPSVKSPYRALLRRFN